MIACTKELFIRRTGNYTYIMTESTAFITGSGNVNVYGIIIEGEGETANIEDISSDKKLVQSFFELISEEELYPVHLNDVTEDFLSGVI